MGWLDRLRRTFTGLTGTPLERLRRRDAWLDYAQALADGVSLRKVAKRCGIVLGTSFRWRHLFLQLPKQKKATAVSGMVEVDETYFLRSQKGARKVAGRKARKRGGKASRPGLSDEHAAVLIARDRTGATTDAVLDKVDTANANRISLLVPKPGEIEHWTYVNGGAVVDVGPAIFAELDLERDLPRRAQPPNVLSNKTLGRRD